MPARAAITAHGAASRQTNRASSDAAASAIAPVSDALGRAVSALGQACGEDGRVALLCIPTLEGILSSVGVAYLAHADERRVRLVSSSHAQARLDEGIVGPFAMDECMLALADRVWRGLGSSVAKGCPSARRGRCSGRCEGACVTKIAYACAADEPSMPEAVHRYVRLAFNVGSAIATMTTHPAVAELDGLARLVLGECERTRQFARFSLLADGSYLASFKPKANTVPFVAAHFARRMGTERFCLVDPVHCVAALHEAGDRRCHVIQLDQALAAALAARDDVSPDERYVRAMWKRLYDSLALDGRGPDERGYDLRASWMPKRFWDDLPELDPRAGNPGAYVPERYQSA